MKMQVRLKAVADVAAFANHFSLLNALTGPNQASSLTNVQINGVRAVGVANDNGVSSRVEAVAVVLIDDANDFARACGTDLRADRHDEIVRVLLPAKMTQRAAVALTARTSDAGLPGEPVRRVGRRGIDRYVVRTGEKNNVTKRAENASGDQPEDREASDLRKKVLATLQKNERQTPVKESQRQPRQPERDFAMPAMR